jgi:hypothetical protein
VPDSISELTGQTSGVVELPLRLDWTPRRSYGLSKPSSLCSLCSLYETVLRSALDVNDMASFVNGNL